MARIFFAFCTALSVAMTPAIAGEISTCEAMGIVANRIMTDRQNGVTMSRMMKAINKGGDPAAAELVKSLIIGAFERPQMKAETNRPDAAVEYQNVIELACYKQGGN